jgi:hypothetical protein
VASTTRAVSALVVVSLLESDRAGRHGASLSIDSPATPRT